MYDHEFASQVGYYFVQDVRELVTNDFKWTTEPYDDMFVQEFGSGTCIRVTQALASTHFVV